MGKSILGLSNKEAREYFLEARNYVTVNLPPYYDIEALLNEAVKEMGDKALDIQKFYQIIQMLIWKSEASV